MSIGEIIIIALTAVAIVILSALLILSRRDKSSTDKDTEDTLGSMLSEIRNLSATVKTSNEYLLHGQNTFMLNTETKINELRERVEDRLINVMKENSANNIQMRELLDKKIALLTENINNDLDKINRDNKGKLDEMQKIIDEKLQTTLEKRFTESFKIMNDQLNSLNKNIGDVQAMSVDVKKFNNILSGVKTRGTWGEIALENLLDNVLTTDQYATQYNIAKNNKVDFVIRMPGKGDQEVLLPIDCKFPMQQYETILESGDSGDSAGAEKARKELINFVKIQARDIKTKYICPPKTTDFAIMYLPTESLYAEVVRTPGLTSEIQNSYKVIICGPTTISALLNSLQLGFKTLVIQKSSAEIFKTLATFRKDFEKFSGSLENARAKAVGIVKEVDESMKRIELIGGRLGKLDKYEPDKLMGGSDEE